MEEKQQYAQAPQPQSMDYAATPPPYDASPVNNYSTPYSVPINNSGGYSNPSFPGSQSNMNQMTNVVVGQPAPVQVVHTVVPDHFGLALLTTLCCFWPLGVVALIRVRDSRAALAVNDIPGALRLAQEAKKISLAGIIVGTSIIILCTSIATTLSINNSTYYAYTD